MKKIISIAFFAVLFLTGCNKILKENPKGSITAGSFYKSNGDLNLAMAGISLLYNGAFNQTWGNTYGGDDVSTYNGNNKVEYSDIDRFAATSSNARINGWWNNLYSTIKSANILLEKYQDATLATSAQRNNAGGFGHFYRAISYFFLTRTWGAVPMPLAAITDENRALTNPDSVYLQIVSDLQKAESMLPDHWEGNQVQNQINVFPTKGSAKALLANVYLTMAGWPLHQKDKYALAAAKAKEVIDNRGTWGYDLVPVEQLWKYSTKYNREAVFACYYNNNVSAWSWENGNMCGPKSWAPDDEGGWTDGYGEINFYNNFPEGPRKEATYQRVYFLKNDPAKAVDYTQTTYKHPYFLKYRDDPSMNWATHSSGDMWWGSATVYMIRYAEVLLTYAEAQAMSGSPDVSAYNAINAVRKRAGTPELPSGLSQIAFRDSVIAERGWEFAGPEPAARWFDLLRTETLGKANSDRNAAEPALTNVPNDQTHAFYWLPIPFNK